MVRLWLNLATLNQSIGNLSLNQTSHLKLTMMLRYQRRHPIPNQLSQTSSLIEVTSTCQMQPRSTLQHTPTKVFRENRKPNTTHSCKKLETSCNFTSRKSPVGSRNFMGDTVSPESDKRSHGSRGDTLALPPLRTAGDLLTEGVTMKTSRALKDDTLSTFM